jgi:hypothetical protein
MMHPAMAVWIWSMAMARAWQGLLWESTVPPEGVVKKSENKRIALSPILVPANDYLHSEIPQNPLPDKLLDRLADLYWTERDADMAV